MFHVVLNAVIIAIWVYIGLMFVKPKLRRMKAEKDEQARRVHKGELTQYALVYLMMMLLLIERVVEAAAKL